MIMRALSDFNLPIVIGFFYLFIVSPGLSYVNCFSLSIEKINMTFYVNQVCC